MQSMDDLFADDTEQDTGRPGSSSGARVHFPGKRSLVQGPTLINTRAASPPKSAIRNVSGTAQQDRLGTHGFKDFDLGEIDLDDLFVDDLSDQDLDAFEEELSVFPSPDLVPELGKASRNAKTPHVTWSVLTLPDPRSLAGDEARDQTVCQAMNTLKERLASLAHSLPTFASIDRSLLLDRLLSPEYAQTVRYIGCLALGGSKGEQSWEELMADVPCREALVYGILARALKEAVFGELWFGGTEAQETELKKMEQDQVQQDGML